MKESCNLCDDLCTCVDWQRSDFSAVIDHLLEDMVFTGLELRYHTLADAESDSMLCVVGECRTCGKRLCSGNALPKDRSREDLLAYIYYWACHFWSRHKHIPINGEKHFRDIFPTLFHQEDRPMVTEWMQRPENGHLALIRRHGETEG